MADFLSLFTYEHGYNHKARLVTLDAWQKADLGRLIFSPVVEGRTTYEEVALIINDLELPNDLLQVR